MWFNGGEVLHVIAEVGAQVLDEAVEQRREVQRVPRRPLVVVRVRVGGRSVVKRRRRAVPVRPGGVRDPASSVIMPVRYRGPAVLPACDSPGSRSARSRCAWTADRRSAYIKTGRTAALAKGSAAALAFSVRVNR